MFAIWILFISLKFTYWSPNPHEITSGDRILIKVKWVHKGEDCRFIRGREKFHSLSAIWTHSHFKSKRELSSETKSCSSLNFGFPASRTVKKKYFSCFLSHSVYDILLEQPEPTNTTFNLWNGSMVI